MPGPGFGRTFPTISAALGSSLAQQAAQRGTLLAIQVSAGRYQERLLLAQPHVTIAAHPPGAEVEVVWATEQPYQSVVDCTARGGCDISGNGLDGVLVRSGAEPSITDCIIHDNKGAGLSLQVSWPGWVGQLAVLDTSWS
ncbi:beta_helix domain-containing protein [Haematococcus lacustris]|uniref:Beta_helix domain-containing protein n=1 Tax=Haematococcus lacustris TaxID=44745 RepID=A0A699YKF6_HAELA|nr:beta_helix domain-containing protein [Haematococcus lacustris]